MGDQCFVYVLFQIYYHETSISILVYLNQWMDGILLNRTFMDFKLIYV